MSTYVKCAKITRKNALVRSVFSGRAENMGISIPAIMYYEELQIEVVPASML